MTARQWRNALLGILLTGGCLLSGASVWAQAQHHMDHVMKSWNDTPGQVALIAILEAEAETALQHAQFAIQDLNNIDNVKLHVPHVRHALNPEVVPAGPGKGYGVIRAAKSVITHMQFAMDSPDATETIKTHAEHVIQSMQNIVRWAEEANTRGNYATGGASAVGSAFHAEEMTKHLGWILNGHDTNGDGKITWEEGEGGLAQAKQHLGYIHN